MSVTRDSFNGEPFPTAVVQKILNDSLEDTPLLGNITVERTNRESKTFLAADPSGFDWRAEGAELPTVALNDDSAVFAPAKLAGLIEITNEAIDDSEFSITGAITNAIRDSMLVKAERDTLYAPAVPNAAAPTPVVPGLGAAVSGDSLRLAAIAACGEILGAGGRPDRIFISPDLWVAEMQGRALDGGSLVDPFTDLGLRTVIVPNLDAEDGIVADSSRVYAVWRKDASIEMSDTPAWSRDAWSFRVKARLVLAIPQVAKAARLLAVTP